MVNEEQPIRRGTHVRLHLQVQLADGTEVLSSFGEDPMELTLGDGTLVTGLEDLLVGLHAGADARFFADGTLLYGPHDATKIHWLARAEFPTDLDLSRGQVVAFDAPGGQEVAGLLLDTNGEQVQVDFNHPLAGRSLQIRAHILSTTDPDDPAPPVSRD